MDAYQADGQDHDDIVDDLAIHSANAVLAELALMAIAGYLFYRFSDNTAFCVVMYLFLWFISGTIVLPLAVLACAGVAYSIYRLCHL